LAVVRSGEPSSLLPIVGPVKEKPSEDELLGWLPVFGVETTLKFVRPDHVGRQA
jgi:hypothetical protein